MKLPRRQFLHLAMGTAALPAVSRVAWAQTYPTKPVRIIVGFAPGGATDIMARLIGQWLSERFSQQFVIKSSQLLGKKKLNGRSLYRRTNRRRASNADARGQIADSESDNLKAEGISDGRLRIILQCVCFSSRGHW